MNRALAYLVSAAFFGGAAYLIESIARPWLSAILWAALAWAVAWLAVQEYGTRNPRARRPRRSVLLALCAAVAAAWAVRTLATGQPSPPALASAAWLTWLAAMRSRVRHQVRRKSWIEVKRMIDREMQRDLILVDPIAAYRYVETYRGGAIVEDQEERAPGLGRFHWLDGDALPIPDTRPPAFGWSMDFFPSLEAARADVDGWRREIPVDEQAASAEVAKWLARVREESAALLRRAEEAGIDEAWDEEGSA